MPVVPEAFREEYRSLVQGAHRGAAAGVLGGARRLHAARHVAAARLRALPLPGQPPEADEGAMNFLAPLFFVALAGLAIPVLLHLTQREKNQIVRFPSLMFVRRIPYQSVRRRKIHNWLLLFVRLAALAMIILAFARPLIGSDDGAAAPGEGAREVVILLDTSYSMGYGTRWERGARRGARRDRPSSAPSIAARWCCSRPAPRSRCARRRERERADRGGRRRRRPARAPRATRRRSRSPAASSPTRSCRSARSILISDFQRAGWRGEEGARLPQGARLTPVPVAGHDGHGQRQRHRGVDGALDLLQPGAGHRHRRRRQPLGPRRSPAATIDAATSTACRWQSKPLTLDAGGVDLGDLRPVHRRASATCAARCASADDALAADNAFNFVVSPTEPLRLALVDRGSAAGALPGARAGDRRRAAIRDDDAGGRRAVGRGPADQRGRRAQRHRRADGAGAPAARVRRAGRRPVRRRRPARDLAGGRRSAARRRSATPSTGRAATTRRGSARSSSATRSSRRSARRAAAISRCRASTATAP